MSSELPNENTHQSRRVEISIVRQQVWESLFRPKRLDANPLIFCRFAWVRLTVTLAVEATRTEADPGLNNQRMVDACGELLCVPGKSAYLKKEKCGNKTVVLCAF